MKHYEAGFVKVEDPTGSQPRYSYDQIYHMEKCPELWPELMKNCSYQEYIIINFPDPPTHKNLFAGLSESQQPVRNLDGSPWKSELSEEDRRLIAFRKETFAFFKKKCEDERRKQEELEETSHLSLGSKLPK